METATKIYQKSKLIHNGMYGFANIELASDKNSKTFIKNLKTKSPILVQRALYNDPIRPNKAHIYLMSSAGGMLQGDILKINIVARKNTETYITTQAATKIYKSENQSSNQHVKIVVEKDSFLEYLPKQIIPHKHAKFAQYVDIKIDTSSLLIFSEIIAAGRIAYGEKFDFDSVKLRLHCTDSHCNLLFSESVNLEPENRKIKFNSLFGNQNFYSTVYIISQKIDSEKLCLKIYEFLKTNFLIGCSQLPNNSGVVIRILSNSIDEINNFISIIRKLTFNHISEL
ncbi:MAG TPA: urease accessory protein UreD, partial [Nitrosopumilaceae archaeon]|nr:urease accessory protein UreD [Nitrosopumilaceae archaeon]